MLAQEQLQKECEVSGSGLHYVCEIQTVLLVITGYKHNHWRIPHTIFQVSHWADNFADCDKWSVRVHLTYSNKVMEQLARMSVLKQPHDDIMLFFVLVSNFRAKYKNQSWSPHLQCF